MSVSATADDIRENYDGVGDPEFVADRVGDITRQQTDEALTESEFEELRNEIESTTPEETELGVIDLGDDVDEIPLIEPITKHISQHELLILEHADEFASEEPETVELVAGRIPSLLNKVTADEFGMMFWLNRSDGERGRALVQALLQSQGGENAGK